MPVFGWSYWEPRNDRRKKWRYPGVPIPYRLQSRYKP